MYIDSMYLRLSNSTRKRDNQWRIQEFQHRGARSRRGRILKSWVCFEAPLHMPYVFVVRVVNKLHVVNIVCWLKSSKYIRVIQSNFTKTTPNFFSNRGARGRRAGPRSAYDNSGVFVLKCDYHFIPVYHVISGFCSNFRISGNTPNLHCDENPFFCIYKGKQKTEQRNRQ